MEKVTGERGRVALSVVCAAVFSTLSLTVPMAIASLFNGIVSPEALITLALAYMVISSEVSSGPTLMIFQLRIR